MAGKYRLLVAGNHDGVGLFNSLHQQNKLSRHEVELKTTTDAREAIGLIGKFKPHLLIVLNHALENGEAFDVIKAAAKSKIPQERVFFTEGESHPDAEKQEFMQNNAFLWKTQHPGIENIRNSELVKT